MTLQEIKNAITEIKKRYRITHSNYKEDEVDGEVKFVELTVRFKVEKKLAFLNKAV